MKNSRTINISRRKYKGCRRRQMCVTNNMGDERCEKSHYLPRTLLRCHRTNKQH